MKSRVLRGNPDRALTQVFGFALFLGNVVPLGPPDLADGRGLGFASSDLSLLIKDRIMIFGPKEELSCTTTPIAANTSTAQAEDGGDDALVRARRHRAGPIHAAYA
jgi:hypothetical protein